MTTNRVRPSIRRFALLGISAVACWTVAVNPAANAVPALAATSSASGDWVAALGYDATFSSYNPAENIITASSLHNAKLAWTGPQGSAPVVIGARVFTVVVTVNSTTRKVSSRLQARDSVSGKLLFAAGIPGCATGNPVYDSGRIYVTAQSACGSGYVPSNLYAYEANTGARSWSVPGAGPRDGFVATDGRIFGLQENHSTGNVTLVARSGETGNLVWQQPYGQYDILAVNGLVIVDSLSAGVSSIEAFAEPTGKRAWTATGEFLNNSTASSAAHVLIAAGGPKGATTTALNTFTGHVLWTSSNGGPASALGPTEVFTSCSLRKFCALSLTTGHVLWSVPAPNFVYPGAVAGGVLYGAVYPSSINRAWSVSDGRSVPLPSALKSSSVTAVSHGRVFGEVSDYRLAVFSLTGH
jgi:outer membrane protein assembly factor BamB